MSQNIHPSDPLEETLNDAKRRCAGGRHIDGGDGTCVECHREIED